MRRGWQHDAYRHSLAAKGIPTKSAYMAKKSSLGFTRALVSAVQQEKNRYEEQEKKVRGARGEQLEDRPLRAEEHAELERRMRENAQERTTQKKIVVQRRGKQ